MDPMAFLRNRRKTVAAISLVVMVAAPFFLYYAGTNEIRALEYLGLILMGLAMLLVILAG